MFNWMSIFQLFSCHATGCCCIYMFKRSRVRAVEETRVFCSKDMHSVTSDASMPDQFQFCFQLPLSRHLVIYMLLCFLLLKPQIDQIQQQPCKAHAEATSLALAVLLLGCYCKDTSSSGWHRKHMQRFIGTNLLVLLFSAVLQIDQIQRQARKAHAEATWARSNANAAGIALSDSELEDEGLFDLTTAAVSAAGAAGKKKKKGAAAAGFEPGTEDRLDSQAAAERAHAAGQLTAGLAGLQRQLAAALSVPLQSSISHKFFTGGLSAAAVAAAAAARTGEVAAAAAAAAAADAGSDDEAAAGGAEGAVLKPHSVLPVDAIAETMQIAARLNQSRAGQVAAAGGTGGFSDTSSKRKQQQAVRESSKARRKAAAALVAAAATKGDAMAKGLAGVVKKVRKQGAGGGAKHAAAQQQVLMARMLMSKNEKKRQRRQGGMVVVRPGAGGAFGRDAQGASALDVLNMSR
jgi:hypothetical protein